jgi:hypothetical protein
LLVGPASLRTACYSNRDRVHPPAKGRTANRGYGACGAVDGVGQDYAVCKSAATDKGSRHVRDFTRGVHRHRQRTASFRKKILADVNVKAATVMAPLRATSTLGMVGDRGGVSVVDFMEGGESQLSIAETVTP